MHRACRCDAILDEAWNRSGEVAARVDLGGDRDDGLLDRLAAPQSLHAPDIALVHLHNAAQLVSDHRSLWSQTHAVL